MRLLIRQLFVIFILIMVGYPFIWVLAKGGNTKATLEQLSSSASAYSNVPSWYATPMLPKPAETSTPRHLNKHYHLSLDEAIWLALRNNPDVKNAQAQRVLDKFSLAVAHWAFEPQFTNQLQVGYDPKTGQLTDTGTLTSTITTPAGTVIKAGYNNDQRIIGKGNSYPVSVTQPLLKGWMQPELTYLDALDNEKLARLSYAESIMTVVKTVISQYMTLLGAYNNLEIQQRQLKETLKQLSQDQLRYQQGQMSRSDYLQVKVQAESYKLTIIQQKNDLKNTQQDFLQVLGLKLDTQVDIDHQVTKKLRHVPSLAVSIGVALKHNVQYQQQKMNLRVAKRELKQSKNQLLPDLSASVGTTFGAEKTDPNVGLTLSIPINDLNSQQSVVEARVGLQKQRIALKAARQQVIRDVTNQWNNVQTDIARIKIAKQSVALQAQTVHDNQLLLKYGRTTIFDFIRIQDSLLSQQLGLIEDQTSLVDDVAALEDEMGVSLQQWHIKLRY